MFCSSCSILAMKRVPHQCSKCFRTCEYKEQSICGYCATIESVCARCGKPTKRKSQVEQVHPFYGSSGGCRNCGH